MAAVGAAVAADLAKEVVSDYIDKDKVESSASITSDDFFKSQIYQQSIQSSSGWTTISQAIVSGVSKNIIEHPETPVDMGAIAQLMELTDKMQQSSLNLMKEMREIK